MARAPKNVFPHADPAELDDLLTGITKPELEPQVSEEEAPLVTLPPEAYSDLVEPPPGAFSDEPPPGWVEPPRTVQSTPDIPVPVNPDPLPAYDPVTSQLSASDDARRSLLEDAARAPGGEPAPGPSTTVAVSRRGSRVPEIRQALARAATLPNTTRYRSRVTIGAAYQYDGALHLAPPYIERNWAAWEDGPAINVPEVGIVKKGQWIVVQDILGDDGQVSFQELKVYDDQVFRALFMETPKGAPDAENPGAAG